MTAADAVAGTNSAGTYFIYKTYGGAVNISKTEGVPGGWIKISQGTPTVTKPEVTKPSSTKPAATVPSVTKPPVSTQAPSAGNTYILSSSVSVYTTADNAVKGISKTGTYPAGKYYIYKVYGGAVNISRTPGTPGAWINPSAVSGKPSPSVPTYMSGEISVDNIYAMIKKLSTDYSKRPVGSVTGKNAAAYIQNTLKSYGYNTSLQPFTASSLYNVQDIDEYNTVRGNNVTAELPGFEPSKKTVVFLCHYDSVIGTPGANDNASGVAVMMETARYLQGKSLISIQYF